jgi:hypothetical protein
VETNRLAGVIRLRTIHGVIAASVSALVIACGAGTQTAPSPPTASSQPQIGSVEGIVKHESFFSGRNTFPIGPLTGAQVVVTEGPATATTFTTAADGAYHFDLPVGPFRLQWSAQSYEAQASAIGMVQAGATTKMSDVVLRLLQNVPVPSWTISGVVRGARGNPVAGALVRASKGDPVDPSEYAAVNTDSAGNFRITSTHAHVDPVYLDVDQSGYISKRLSIRLPCCDSGAAATVIIQLLRSGPVTLDGPSSMQVGETASLLSIVDLGNGSHLVSSPLVTSSNPSVVRVLESTAPDYRTLIRAVGPGTATVSDSESTLQIRVYP